jgi:hypothetical protein
MINTRSTVACAAAFLVIGSTMAHGQAPRSTTFYSVAAGIAAQPSLFGVRSNFGASLGLGVGRNIAAHSSLEARIGGEFFPAGDLRINPGTCLFEVPCQPPRPSEVRVATLAGDYVLSGGTSGIRPTLIVGLGYRYIDESPEAPSESRPFAEVGAGFARSVGGKSISLEGRLQIASASADLPRWTVPVGINVRFF